MKFDFSKIAELLLDANVMIDFRNSDNLRVAELISKEISCSIVEQTRHKVTGLTKELCQQIGIEVIEPEYADLVTAEKIRGNIKQLAEDDALTLAVALRKGHTVVSNDKRVVETGRANGIDVQREFFILVFLVRKGVLSSEDCIKIATEIVNSNPWMSNRVLTELVSQIQNSTQI